MNNFDPDGMDDASVNDAAMQATRDPYPASSISKPTDLTGEVQGLRYQIKAILGEAQWYIDPDTSLLLEFNKGADVASASALPTPTNGNSADVTGTTTVTSIVARRVGSYVRYQFDAALILTHHATDLILPTGANITTAAGDNATFFEYATGDWRCIHYQRASGEALVAFSGTLGPALAADITLTAVAASPPDANTLVKDNIPKMWFNLDGTGTPAYNDSYNVTGSPTDNGTGDYTLTINTDFADTNYAWLGTARDIDDINNDCFVSAGVSDIKTTGSLQIIVTDTGGVQRDSADISVVCFGAQA